MSLLKRIGQLATQPSRRQDNDPDLSRLRRLWKSVYGTDDGVEPFLVKFQNNPQISFAEFAQQYILASATLNKHEMSQPTPAVQLRRSDNDPDLQRLQCLWIRTYGSLEGLAPFMTKFKNNPHISFTQFVQTYVMATEVFGKPSSSIPDPTRRPDDDPDVSRLQTLWVLIHGSESGFEPFLRKFMNNPQISFSEFIKKYMLGTSTLPEHYQQRLY